MDHQHQLFPALSHLLPPWQQVPFVITVAFTHPHVNIFLVTSMSLLMSLFFPAGRKLVSKPWRGKSEQEGGEDGKKKRMMTGMFCKGVNDKRERKYFPAKQTDFGQETSVINAQYSWHWKRDVVKQFRHPIRAAGYLYRPSIRGVTSIQIFCCFPCDCLFFSSYH